MRGGGKSQQGHPVNEGKWGEGGTAAFPTGVANSPSPGPSAKPHHLPLAKRLHPEPRPGSSATRCAGPPPQLLHTAGAQTLRVERCQHATQHSPPAAPEQSCLGSRHRQLMPTPEMASSRWGDRILAPQPTQEDQPPPSGVLAPAPFSSKLQIWFVVRSQGLRGDVRVPPAARCSGPSGLQAFGQEGLRCPNCLSTQLPARSGANVAATEGKAGRGTAKTQSAFASRVAPLSSAPTPAQLRSILAASPHC